MKAWYFSTNAKRLRYGDNRVIRKGITHKVKLDDDHQLSPCSYGLHASKSVFDALEYAPGSYVWRVDLRGQIEVGDNKVCAESRTYLWGFDAEDVLRRFARKCALDVIHLWNPPQIVVDYLNTSDESLRAAAWDAAWDAARAADWDVAQDAAQDAAWAAAWAAARAAARAADWDVAWDAVWDAARVKQKCRIAAMINAEAKKRGLI